MKCLVCWSVCMKYIYWENVGFVVRWISASEPYLMYFCRPEFIEYFFDGMFRCYDEYAMYWWYDDWCMRFASEPYLMYFCRPECIFPFSPVCPHERDYFPARPRALFWCIAVWVQKGTMIIFVFEFCLSMNFGPFLFLSIFLNLWWMHWVWRSFTEHVGSVV